MSLADPPGRFHSSTFLGRCISGAGYAGYKEEEETFRLRLCVTVPLLAVHLVHEPRVIVMQVSALSCRADRRGLCA